MVDVNEVVIINDTEMESTEKENKIAEEKIVNPNAKMEGTYK